MAATAASSAGSRTAAASDAPGAPASWTQSNPKGNSSHEVGTGKKQTHAATVSDHRLSFDDDDDDDDDIDSRYAIDSYQAGSSAPASSSTTAATARGGPVVFDANAAEQSFGSDSMQQQKQGPSFASGPGRPSGTFAHSAQQHLQHAAQQQGIGRSASYQSPLPAWGSAALARNAAAGGGGAAGSIQSSQLASSGAGIIPDHHSYATSQGWSISNLSMAAWAFPPFTSVAILIWETENDLARFHAYQSGICGVALILLLWVLRSWLGWYSLSIIVGMGAVGWFWVCGSAAAANAPMLERVPYVAYAGPLAEQWVGDE
ncbi:hypothetical protein K437DRAFT_235944 [Tilletiaria anomala UBC 951]|uniref:Uncharacterized protein n=1 Tax=Tilletiaria anomala (strain ATCC 24038 / CBS 436.72 / UBC 951) TaxID=1037660 RepID=A0A066W2J4_TILAU|nr:uncharacterized protein K437DRAFT_235944 [Tilletiaria anomala UBC 951]KDN45294.1 hypothetical protein K437DRAFT_235944 [Tilletiaria anomala UBC 951]